MTRFVDPRQWTAIDVESSGRDEPIRALQPWSPHGFLTSTAVAQYSSRKIATAATAPRASVDDIREFVYAHLTSGKVMVGWNVAFDAAWFIALGLRDEVMAADWLDGMLLWKAYDRECESHLPQPKRRKYGLKEAVRLFLPKYAGYEDDVQFHGDLSDEQWRDLLRYNRRDAALTLRLAHFFVHKLRDTPQMRAAAIEAKAIPEIADHYIRGLTVNTLHAFDLSASVLTQRDRLGLQLEAHGADDKVLASPAKLRNLLFEDWGLPVIKMTPGGDPSTDKESLHELSFQDDRAALVREYRELGNLRTKFVEKILESCEYNEEPVTHPTAMLGGTYTGRMTFASSVGKGKEKRQTGFAIHQMSGKPEYRKIITAPEGYAIVELDAAGQEFRWMAVETEDPTMLSLCEAGEDAHAFMGAEIDRDWEYRDLQAAAKTGDAAAGKSRKAGKVSNLSCQYRIGKKKFRTTADVQYGLRLTEDEASMMHDTYHNTYPGVKKYWRRAVAKAKRNGYAETLAGRRVQLDVDWSNESTSWVYESAAINFPIQGVGADQKFLAIATLRPLLPKFGAYFYFELHDGIYFIVPERRAMKFAVTARRVLNNINYARAWHGFLPPIPLPWDAKVGPSWGELKELD